MITRDFFIISTFLNSKYTIEYASNIQNILIKDMEDGDDFKFMIKIDNIQPESLPSKDTPILSFGSREEKMKWIIDILTYKRKADEKGLKLSILGKKLKDSKKLYKVQKFAKKNIKLFLSTTSSLKDKALDLFKSDKNNQVPVDPNIKPETTKQDEPITRTFSTTQPPNKDLPPIPPKPRNFSVPVLPNFG